MKNIHVIPTNKPSKLVLNNQKKLWFNPDISCKSGLAHPQHIYITSDEEIKEGNWYIDDANQIRKSITSITSDKQYWAVRQDYKKIILTTDPDLIKDGVQAIDDEFLEWFVKNSSCEKVEIESLNIGGGKTGYVICKPQETLEDVIERLSKDAYKKQNGSNTVKRSRMENLKDKILDTIQNNYESFKGTNEAELQSAEDITEMIIDVNVKFIEWYEKSDFVSTYQRRNKTFPDMNNSHEKVDTKHRKELFEYFIRNHYGI